MAAEIDPRTLAHRVLVTVAECGSQTKNMLFSIAARKAISSDRRVFVLGVRRDGRIVMCNHPGCDHPGVPSAVPVKCTEGYRSPRGVIEWRAPGFFLPNAIGLDWPPGDYLMPWWLQ